MQPVVNNLPLPVVGRVPSPGIAQPPAFMDEAESMRAEQRQREIIQDVKNFENILLAFVSGFLSAIIFLCFFI